jgi:subtilisin family serine protease
VLKQFNKFFLGTSILNTLPASRSYYGYLTGTSMATPLVAGVAALMMAAKPGTTAQQVRELLQNTAIDLGTAGKVRARRPHFSSGLFITTNSQDNEFGYGKVNPVRAIKGNCQLGWTD